MSEEQFPLPWNPDENCEINKEKITTRLESHPEEEVVGNLFNRECEGLDNNLPRRKDKFIDCVSIPEVPKAKLVKEDYDLVPFPGLPEVEIPKRLLSHLLSCCLEGRSAGFSFEVEQELELDELEQKYVKTQIENIDTATTTLSIRLGTFGALIFGLNIKHYECFCDEECGDEDYIHLKVNLDAKYLEGDWDIERPEEEPDVYITDEQLTTLISNYAGNARSECSRKVFGTYTGSTSQSHYLFQPTDGSSDEIPALVAPYLHNLSIIQGGIYKLEYFCEYEDWYVTDGECTENVSGYVPVHNLGIEGGSQESIYGEIILPVTSAEGATVSASYNSTSSTLTVAEAFTTAPTFEVEGRTLYVDGAIIKAGADGVVVYDIVITQTTTTRVYGTKIAIRVKSTDPPEEEEEEEEE